VKNAGVWEGNALIPFFIPEGLSVHPRPGRMKIRIMGCAIRNHRVWKKVPDSAAIRIDLFHAPPVDKYLIAW
jgi:hypothetical protein